MDVHEWTDETTGRRWAAVAGAGLAPYGTAVASKEVGNEILRLAQKVERLAAEATFAPDRVLEAVKLGERARIRQALRSIALNSPDLRLNLSLGEIDAICPKEPSDG